MHTLTGVCDVKIENLLYGLADADMEVNKAIFDAVHKFISSSGRF